jgi:hypothetical protein
MLTKPLLIATFAAGLSAATFSTQVSADPIGGAIVGGAIGAAVGGPPGAAVGAILGTAIGTDMYYNGPRHAYGPAPYYRERYFAPPSAYAASPGYAPAPVYAPPPGAYYEPTPTYYAPRVAPVYYAPRIVYAPTPNFYGPRRYAYERHRHYSGRFDRADYPRYR